MNYLGISIGGTKCITVLGREENDTIQILGCRRVETKAVGGPMRCWSGWPGLATNCFRGTA